MKAVLATLLMIPGLASADTIKWTHVDPASVTGYRIHYGTSSGIYSTTIDVPPLLPDEGGIYYYEVDLPDTVIYLAVTAYNSNGESAYSNEGQFITIGKPGTPFIP